MGCTSPVQLQQGQLGWTSLLCSHVLVPLPLPQVCRWRDCRISLCSSRSQQWTNLSPQKVNFLLSQFSFMLYLASLCWLDLLWVRSSCSPLYCWVQPETFQRAPITHPAQNGQLLCSDRFVLQDLDSKPLCTCKIQYLLGLPVLCVPSWQQSIAIFKNAEISLSKSKLSFMVMFCHFLFICRKSIFQRNWNLKKIPQRD